MLEQRRSPASSGQAAPLSALEACSSTRTVACTLGYSPDSIPSVYAGKRAARVRALSLSVCASWPCPNVLTPDPLYVAYHDEEWGVPVHDDKYMSPSVFIFANVVFYSLWYFQPEYTYVDGDGTVPAKSAKADGLPATARVGVCAGHRALLRDKTVFQLIQKWLRVSDKSSYHSKTSRVMDGCVQ
ncbi:hypothetical protein IFM89_007020 [Coptis chinensis]|uniref:Uncharacterized protein n=1 Tax=Coptis chinensis TaxID=261450 RepID=A0A835II77_9MAGN|nr:hypothetical protein IFM89_007020 [Coptis chinensis]